MDTFRIKPSETLTEPVRIVLLTDGRRVKKVVDKNFLKTEHSDIRSYVQLLFFFVTLWIGADFYLFVRGLERWSPPRR